MYEIILSALKAVWAFLKRIFVKICSFVSNILSFFRDKERLRKLQETRDRIAVSIREKLVSGEYNVVNCLFDTSTNEVVDAQTDAEVIEAEDLDAETMGNFGDKDMIVIR